MDGPGGRAIFVRTFSTCRRNIVYYIPKITVGTLYRRLAIFQAREQEQRTKPSRTGKKVLDTRCLCYVTQPLRFISYQTAAAFVLICASNRAVVNIQRVFRKYSILSVLVRFPH